MIREMRWLLLCLLIAAAPARSQVSPAPIIVRPPVASPVHAVWNPGGDYITVGQDEWGYRAWYGAVPSRWMHVRAFNNYLTQWGVGGIVPTWQLLRTATSWHRCGGQPFEVPPTSEWPHIVQTLRYINDYVVPTIGPVEAVSAYRNPILNACAGGAPESAHKQYSAIDLVPLRPTTREALMRNLCAVHARRGTDYEVGLGFYAFLRFHVDTTKYRRWGADSSIASTCPPIVRPREVATVVAQPQQPAIVIPPLNSPHSAPPTAGTLSGPFAVDLSLPPSTTPVTIPSQQPSTQVLPLPEQR